MAGNVSVDFAREQTPEQRCYLCRTDDGHSDYSRSVQPVRSGRRDSWYRSETSMHTHRRETRLAPMQIGKAGQLQEWLDDWDLEAPERQHRHVSHLYGLFPSNQITAREYAANFLPQRRRVWNYAEMWERAGVWRGRSTYGPGCVTAIGLISLLQKALSPVYAKEFRGGGGVYRNLVRRSPAISNRRKFWGHVGHRGNAAAEPHGRDRVVAGVALRMAQWIGKGFARPRWL